MSTCNRQIATEVAVVSAILVSVVAVVSPADPWLPSLGFHPAWIAVAAFAGRYGPRGLYWSLAIVWGSVAFVTVAAGIPPEALARRVQQADMLFALIATLLVAWMSMLNEGRLARMRERMTAAVDRESEASETMSALRDGLEYLRARCDRIDMSLAFWRDIAARIERGDAAQASRAALDLCAARCGASAGVVQLWGARRGVIAWRGAWSPWDPRPRDISRDNTACAAVVRGAPVLASEVTVAREADSDLAVPIIDDADRVVIGVIALRGVDPEALRGADFSDLETVAEWLTPILTTIIRKPRLRAVPEESVQCPM